MRADARRNRKRLLDVARDVFVARGSDASLEEIARRSGLGIATLYRRFGDRDALMRAVVQTGLEATAEAAERARADHADPFDALAEYVHAVLDLRTAAVIPALLERLARGDPALGAARAGWARLAGDLFPAAQRAGALRPDATSADIGLMIARLSQPLPGAFTPDAQRALAHRHADLVLSGVRAAPLAQPLHGPALGLGDLQELPRPARDSGRS